VAWAIPPAPLQGIFPSLVSPVDIHTGKVKTAVLGWLVEYLIEQGIHGLSPLGSTGEAVRQGKAGSLLSDLHLRSPRSALTVPIDMATG
jgi:hypothetical protein